MYIHVMWNNIIMQAGGPSYAVELGRLDGLTSTSSSVNGKLPQPSSNLKQLNSLFAANGLSQTDMIALSGTTPSTRHPHYKNTTQRWIKMPRPFHFMHFNSRNIFLNNVSRFY